jgi:Protein of unknown function (DUF2971)
MPRISDFVLDEISSVPPRLYHYTSQPGLLGILKTKTFWSTRIQFLNDSREFVHTLDLWKRSIQGAIDGLEKNADRQERIRVLNALFRGLDSTPRIPIHVGCFSEDGDSLSQWRGYCPPSGGFSIGFSGDQLVEAAGRQFCFISRCFYDEAKQQELVDKLLKICIERVDTKQPEPGSDRWSIDIIHDFVFLAAILKNPSFKEEREWRFVSQGIPDGHPQMGIRPGKMLPVPYYAFELAGADEPLDLEIVVGPNPEINLAVESVKSLLALHKCKGSVRPTVIPYRYL